VLERQPARGRTKLKGKKRKLEVLSPLRAGAFGFSFFYSVFFVRRSAAQCEGAYEGVARASTFRPSVKRPNAEH